MKHIALWAPLLFLPFLDAFGQTANGTVVSINSSQDEIVISADSRDDLGNHYSDEGCKVSALGKDIVFAASGRNGVRNKVTHVYLWDSFTIARNVYRKVPKASAPEAFVEALAAE